MSYLRWSFLTVYLLLPVAPVLAMPPWLAQQVNRGNLTRQEAQLLDEGIRSGRGTPAKNRPPAFVRVKDQNRYDRSSLPVLENVAPVLNVYISQLRAPGLTPQEVSQINQEAAPLLREAAAPKLQEYQQTLTLALNQAKANQFTQQQDQEAQQREVQQQQQRDQLRAQEEETQRNSRYVVGYSYTPSSRYRRVYPFSSPLVATPSVLNSRVFSFPAPPVLNPFPGVYYVP
ncbi:hypothetical protein [Anthocerotibacter panamensis]|uniref:hypothetical protein n=1 Tax=Anthocerotibacter panamensis TaxID=2857077 RepID=UPI001C406567|nr:hypothetical protein [Anthocerotibacter panamensis]